MFHRLDLASLLFLVALLGLGWLCFTSIVQGSAYWQILLLCFILFSLAGGIFIAFRFQYKKMLYGDRLELKKREQQFESQQAEFERKVKEFQEMVAQREEEFNRQLISIIEQENSLQMKLRSYQEWLEFPSFSPSVEFTDEEIANWREKSEKVDEILERTSELIFKKLFNKKYHIGDRFNRSLLFDDIVGMINEIARVYSPQSEQPLLETNINKLIRAINHVAVQLLIQLETFPFNLDELNLKTIRKNVRRGIKVHGFYKNTIKPYLPLAKNVWYASRVTTAVNPIGAMGMILVQEAAKRGATYAGKYYAEKYSLLLLKSLIYTIGYETADVFGNINRFNQSGLVLGAELVNVVHHFPQSKDTLRAVMKEINSLILPGEYDRLYLYRCLSSGKEVEHRSVSGYQLLSLSEKEAIAEKLEVFFERYIHGKKPKVVERWRSEVEKRLGVLLKIKGTEEPTEHSSLLFDVLSSLMGFMVEHKELEPNNPLIAKTLKECLAEFAELEEYGSLVRDVIRYAPMLYKEPNIEPDSPLADIFIRGLMHIVLRLNPFQQSHEAMFFNAIHFFRMDEKAWAKRFDKAIRDEIEQSLHDDSPRPSLSQELVRKIRILENDFSPIRYIYPKVSVFVQGEKFPVDFKNPLLLVFEGAMAVIGAFDREAEPGEIQVLWFAEPSSSPPLRWKEKEGRLSRSFEITGGIVGTDLQRVKTGGSAPRTDIRLEIAGTIGFNKEYFKPLTDYLYGLSGKWQGAGLR